MDRTVHKFLITGSETIWRRIRWFKTHRLVRGISTWRVEEIFITTAQRHFLRKRTIFRRKIWFGPAAFSTNGNRLAKITCKSARRRAFKANLRIHHRHDPWVVPTTTHRPQSLSQAIPRGRLWKKSTDLTTSACPVERWQRNFSRWKLCRVK